MKNEKLKMKNQNLKSKKLIIAFLFGLIFFIPNSAFASLAEDFNVNNQSTYAIPRTTSQVLILDLTLPEPAENSSLQLKSIKIHNAGTAVQADISKMILWEDGSSPGWDNDETEIVRVYSSPFWDIDISGNFSEYSFPFKSRIFVTCDISSIAVSGRTIKPQLSMSSDDNVAVQFVFATSTANGPVDVNVIGFERTILAGASHPTAPAAPLAKAPEAISTTTIRWNFFDLSNNEFGFKILDSNLQTVARGETANLSSLDETNLQPNTEYSGRRVVAFNDRGESSFSALFPAVFTLAPEPKEEIAEEAVEVVEEVIEEEIVEEAVEEPAEEEIEEVAEEKTISEMNVSEIKIKIQEIQQMIVELLSQLIQMIQLQIAGI